MVLVLVLVVCYMVAEVVGGLLSNSLALLADAGHMASDAGALIVALAAMSVGRRPASQTHTFGFRRAEILGALVNGLALVAIAGFIAYQAIGRLDSPPHVQGPTMLAVASGGLIINLAGLFILHGGRDDSLNVHGAWLHVLADTLGSVGAIASGALVTGLGWNLADPVASLLIAALVLCSAWVLLKQTTAILMQAAPEGIDVSEVGRTLTSVDGVVGAHDLHVWSLTSGREVLSAHLTAAPGFDRQAIMSAVHERLRRDFNLRHSTIQLDCPGDCAPCEGSSAEEAS